MKRINYFIKMKAIVWNNNKKFESYYLILASIHLLVKFYMCNVLNQIKKKNKKERTLKKLSLCFFD